MLFAETCLYPVFSADCHVQLVVADNSTREELMVPGEAAAVYNGQSDRRFTVVGGNHSTIALQRLSQAFPERPQYRHRRCLVFDSTVNKNAAIRYGQLHNEFFEKKMLPHEFYNLAFKVVDVGRSFSILV